MYKLIRLGDDKDVWAVKNGKRHLIINSYTFKKGIEDRQWTDQVDSASIEQFNSLEEGDVFVRVPNE